MFAEICSMEKMEDVNREPLQELNGHILFISGDSTCQQAKLLLEKLGFVMCPNRAL